MVAIPDVSRVSSVSGLETPSQVRRFNRVSPDSRSSEISKNRSDLRLLHSPLEKQVKKLLEKAKLRSERFHSASNKLYETVSALAGVELKSTDEVLNFLVGLKDEKTINQVAEAMMIFYNTTGISKNISIAEIEDGINKLHDPDVFNKAMKVANFAARQILDNSVTNPKLASVANNSVTKPKLASVANNSVTKPILASVANNSVTNPELASLAKKSPSTTQNESLRELAA